mgnify:CR=1 FL=1
MKKNNIFLKVHNNFVYFLHKSHRDLADTRYAWTNVKIVWQIKRNHVKYNENQRINKYH